MAKVLFKRYETDAEAQNSDIVDGQFIVTKEGTSYIDYGTDRVPTNGTRDTTMSDTSQNAVQNKVIKEYVDTEISDGIQEAKDYVDIKNTYSTTETQIGTWLGRPLYRKVITGALSNAVNHGISNATFHRAYGGYYNSAGTIYFPLANVRPNASTYEVGFYVDETKINFDKGSSVSTAQTFEIVLEYTKNN